MSKAMKIKGLFLLILFLIILLLSGTSVAQNITITEAIQLGLQANYDLQQIKENILNLERELDLLDAREDWQLEVNTEYEHSFMEDYSKGANIKLQINKSFPTGLSLNPVLSVNEAEVGLAINLSQELWPRIPTAIEQQRYKLEQELLQAQGNLVQLEADKVISWLNTYLDICRLLETKEIYLLSKAKAEDNLERVLQKAEIGEAGQEEILSARLSLLNSEYLLAEINDKIAQSRDSLLQEMGLGEEIDLEFNPDAINQLKEKAEKKVETLLAAEDLLKLVKENNYKLMVQQIAREILNEELKWLEAEGKGGLNLQGGYDSSQEEVTVGLSFSYELYDGGQYQLEIEGKKGEIAANIAEEEDLVKDLALELKQQLSQLDLTQLNLEKEQLNLEKKEYEAKVAEKQFELGLIDYLELQETWLASQEAIIDFKALKDQELITKLNFIKLVNPSEITGGVLND